MSDTTSIARNLESDVSTPSSTESKPWNLTIARAAEMAPPESPASANAVDPERWTAEWFNANFIGSVKRSAEDVANATHIVHIDKEVLPQADIFSPEWILQTAGSLAIQAPVYVGLGRLAGAGMRQYATANSLESRLFGKLAAGDTVPQMVGAGAFDLARDPEQGETRAGNFARGQVMFGILGPRVGLELNGSESLPAAFGKNFSREYVKGLQMFGAGAAGSIVGQEINNPGQRLNAEEVFKSSVLGYLLPSVQERGVRIANFVDRSLLGRGIPIGRYIDEKGWSSDPQINALRNTDARLLRISESDGAEQIVAGRNVRITPSENVLAHKESFAHEVGHKLNEPNLFANIEAAKNRIQTTEQKFDAQQLYIQARRRDEEQAKAFAAKTIGNPIEAKSDQNNPPLQSKTHENQYAVEATEFARTNGEFLPQISYAGGHGHGDGSSLSGGSRLVRKSPLEFDDKTGVRTFNYDTPQKVNIEGKDYDVLKYSIRPKEGGKPGELDYQKLITVTGHEYTFDTKGTKTAYGAAEYAEIGPGKVYERYTIKTPPDPNPFGIVAGSKIEVYPMGAQTPFGTAHLIQKQPDGSTVYRNNSAEKAKNFDAYENVPSKPYEFGVYDNVVFDSVSKQSDGSILRTNKQGSSLYEFPPGDKVAVSIMHGTTKEVIPGVTQIFRAGDNGTVYRGDFGEVMVDKDGNGGLRVVKFFPNKEPEVSTATRAFEDYREQYPSGLLYERSPNSTTARERDRALYVDTRPNGLRYYAASGDSIVELNSEWAGHGITRIEHSIIPAQQSPTGKSQIGDQTRIYADGLRYTSFVKPRASLEDPAIEQVREKPAGEARGYWQHGSDNITFDVPGIERAGISWPQYSNQSFSFDQPFTAEINGASWSIRHTQRDLDKVTYTTADNDRIIVPLGTFEPIRVYSADGTLRSADLGRASVEMFNPPQMTPYGAATKVAVRTDGSVRYEITGHPTQVEVIQFVAPKSVTVGTVGGQSQNLEARYAKRSKEGTWQLVLQDGRQVPATEDLLLKIRKAPVEDRSGSFYTPAHRAASGGGAAQQEQLGDESMGDFPGHN